MRQEQEMGACTFQPNCRCRSPPSTPLNKSGTGPVASSRTDNGGGGGIDAGDEEVGQGEEARRGEGTEGFRRNKSSTRRKDRSASRDSIEIGHRLFMESKRLNERKFEGKERKRMAEEEAYARSCTFKVASHWDMGQRLWFPWELHHVSGDWCSDSYVSPRPQLQSS